jgi:hypothetical protein
VSRDFQNDFLRPAIDGLSVDDQHRIAVALDTAICFGVLEYAGGNSSLQDLKAVAKKYNENVDRLSGLRTK